MSPCVIFSETWFWYTGPKNFGLARRQSLVPAHMDFSNTFGPKRGKYLETRKWSQLFNDYHVCFQPLINRNGEKGRKSKNIPRWIWIFLHFFFPAADDFPLLFLSGSGKRRRKQDHCCGHLNSLSAIKYAIVSLYILVLLTIFGLCLTGRHPVNVRKHRRGSGRSGIRWLAFNPNLNLSSVVTVILLLIFDCM